MLINTLSKLLKAVFFLIGLAIIVYGIYAYMQEPAETVEQEPMLEISGHENTPADTSNESAGPAEPVNEDDEWLGTEDVPVLQ